MVYKYGRTIPEFLVRLREEHGLSQGALSKMMGITPQYISNIERGVSKAPVAFCAHLISVLEPKRQEALMELMQEAIHDSAESRLKNAQEAGLRSYQKIKRKK